MKREELYKAILNRIAYKHGKESAFYRKYRDKMLQFPEKTWNELLARYVNENNEIDFKKIMVSIRERKTR